MPIDTIDDDAADSDDEEEDDDVALLPPNIRSAFAAERHANAMSTARQSDTETK